PGRWRETARSRPGRPRSGDLAFAWPVPRSRWGHEIDGAGRQEFSDRRRTACGALLAVVLAPIGEHVDDLAGANRFLQTLPVFGGVEIAMQLGKQPAQLDVGKQEGGEFFREHVVRTD